MQRYMETLFDIAYLVIIITLGIIIFRGARKNFLSQRAVESNSTKKFLLFGLMAIILGLGDAFHLIPRIWALNTTGIENFAAALGFGTFITSLTMTVFYLLLYHFWRLHYNIKKQNGLTAIIYLLGAIRTILCLFPQNQWLVANAPVSWGIYRNIPFVILGLFIVILFYQLSHKTNDTIFKFMWLAISLSFIFYLPVVLWVNILPAFGMLMIPKTCAYIWIIFMGYKGMKQL